MTRPSAQAFAAVNNRAKYFAFFALVAASVILWWQSLAATLGLALHSDACNYILLILPLSCALNYLEVKTVGVSEFRGSVGPILLSAALLVRALTAWNIGHLTDSGRLSLSMLGLVIFWIGSVISCFGLQSFRDLLFPLCFLFLVVPLPERVLNWITEFLQNQSAIAAELLFRAAWVPVARDGVFLSIPGLDIEVAHECSSIRSSEMLIIITLILAHLFLRSPWRKTLLILAAIPLSVAKNAVRIFTIAELGTRVDPGYLHGRLHHQGGIVFLSLALVVDVLLLWLLRKSEGRTAPSGV